MKRGFQGLGIACACALTLIGCGQAVQTDNATVESIPSSCAGNAMPKQFIVKHTDGTIKVVHAESETALLQGYIKNSPVPVQYAEHDYVVRALPVQTQTVTASTTIADNWGPARVEADKLWAQNVRGDGVLVAIVDTGMDITHPQLAKQVAFNPGETGLDAHGNNKQTNGIDDDNNGYIDDYAGYDFADKHGLTGDNQYHGTHVSGIIAAYHTDSVAQAEPYVQGIAPNVKLLPLAFLDNNGTGVMSDAVLAINYAVARGAKVINASWGGTQCSQTLKEVIVNLALQNIIFVNAAGNDGQDVDNYMEYPASLDLLAQITIGATGDHDYMADYSNYGAKAVHLFAPGTNITSTLPANSMGLLSGTSMATPFVTGAVALLLSQVPSATATQIRNALYNSASHNTDYINASQGRLDLAQALVQLHQIVGQ